MASTQFESLDARRAFPCWDEPARKAIFGVTLVVSSDLTAFSNMPEISCRSLPGGKLKEITYADSPRMSSYLVAFCVGEFDFVQGITDHGVTVRVYTPPGKSENGRFSLDCALKTLDLYDDFFGTPYPLPKLDMVAIPEFAAGAMENWGLVTYREVELLIDEVKASSAQRQRVCMVVAHELAHQWFGNLVTMAWWDDLWLNEGFATWTADFASDVMFPDWRIWDQYTTGNLAAALRLDALRSSHPIQVPIAHAEEVDQVFDAISYCKGGSVVRMIHAVLGKKDFQAGLANYMKKHQYGNTETYNLWQAWEESSGLPVSEMMGSWTEQMGFPMLSVTDEKWEDTSVTLTLQQDWFLADGSELSEEDVKKTWCVPILTCTSEGMQSDITFMREKTATITIPLSSPNAWVKLNAGQQVPIRVCMSDAMTDRLADGITSKKLLPSDRAGVLADAYALVKAGKLSPPALIKLLSHYIDEDDAVVWEALESVLNGLDTVLSDNETLNGYFDKFAKKLVSGLTKVVSWDPQSSDGHLTSLLRGTMVRLLSKFCYDDETVKHEATSRFAKFQEDASDVTSLPSDMRTSVFKIVLKNGGQKEYDLVKSYFDTATDNAERKFVMNSLGATPDPKLKLQTMEWTTSGKVKLQDMFYPMGSVGTSSKEGREISWKYYKENFAKIKGMIEKGSSSLMNACIVYCCGSFCSNEKADDIEAFFKENPLPSSQRKIDQTVESMRANAKFLEILRTSELSKEMFWSEIM